MQTKHLTTIILSLLALTPARVAIAQSYSISWFKIGGGGGTSTNGQYAVSGTIGQHDAGGPMINGPYSLTGGFWSFLSVVQTPGAPILKVVSAGPGQVTISWSPDTPGYRLQETLVASPASWINSPSGSANPVTVPIAPPAKYYRLIKP
jgi:hypothetical protein